MAQLRKALSLSYMNGSQIFAGLSLLALLGTVYVGVVTQSLVVGVLLGVIGCMILLILRPMLMPAGYGANKIRLASLVGVFALAGLWGAWGAVFDAAVQRFATSPWVKANAPYLAEIKFSQEPSIFILVFVAVVVIAVNYFIRERTIDNAHPRSIDKDFPEEGFGKKLESFYSVLDRHLVHLDLESNWSPEYYTELKAEVEIVSNRGKVKSKKVLNLQNAISMDRTSQAFLLLGVPGAGKSVALRKLAGDMLAQARRSGRIPIYINLREWRTKGGASLPVDEITVDGLIQFMVRSLAKRGDVYHATFVKDYFFKLWRHGRLFFIFDSFDEMPNLLDAGEDSAVLAELSTVISKVISSSVESRGILASRIFRSPSHYYQAQKILEIRPLSEVSISEALERFPHVSLELKSEIFRARNDLVPLARNPFLMTLLGEWISDKQVLPKSQAEIYEFYLRKRLASCADKLDEVGMGVEEVLEATRKIAYSVFSTPALGLEAPISVLDKRLPSENVEKVVDILNYARIARVSDGPQKSFAFVHRRFLEYFVTLSLLGRSAVVPVDHIPTDSRGRDAVVLYAQHCSDEEAQRLAELCWAEVEENFEQPETRMRAIHCLRFIVEAFCSRKRAVLTISDQLERFIEHHSAVGADIILAKICLEGTGLISEAGSVTVLTRGIRYADAWLQETAFRACRVLPRLASDLEAGIVEYVKEIPIVNFFSSYNVLSRSLLLSDSMGVVSRVASVRWVNAWCAIVSLVLIALLSPAVVALALVSSSVAMVFCLYVFWGDSFNKHFAGSMAAALIDWKIKVFRFFVFLAAVANVINMSGTDGGKKIVLTVGAGDWVSAGYFETVLRAFFIEVQHAFPALWGVFEGPPFLVAVSTACLSMLVLDWLGVVDYFKNFWQSLQGRSFNLRSACYIVAMAVIVTLFAWLLIEYELIAWVFYFIVVMIVLMLFCYMVAVSIWLVQLTLDYFYMRGVAIRPQMARQRIAEVMKSLRTQSAKIRFVQRLDAARTEPAGTWPDDFKLRVGGGAGLSQLARLEARWLKLDR
ncbi:NACHT domain-containing protein [Pseudomonas sp. NPDC089752]|uniref:NACHT domain-containing protein n=1 Tax=Pseudomonas sp. NPDC089752 TaxID=3364472 RepID=UPI003818ED8A